MSEITIRELNSNEWQLFKAIRLEALKTNPMAFSNTYEDVLKYSDEKWQQQLQDAAQRTDCVFCFAFDNKQVIGMNGAWWNNKPITKHVAEVFGVFVNPAYRGKGIGKRLMQSIIDEVGKIPQFTKVKLGVTATNLPALKLYESCGLKVVGKHEKELKFGDEFYDELLMEMLF